MAARKKAQPIVTTVEAPVETIANTTEETTMETVEAPVEIIPAPAIATYDYSFALKVLKAGFMTPPKVAAMDKDAIVSIAKTCKLMEHFKDLGFTKVKDVRAKLLELSAQATGVQMTAAGGGSSNKGDHGWKVYREPKDYVEEVSPDKAKWIQEMRRESGMTFAEMQNFNGWKPDTAKKQSQHYLLEWGYGLEKKVENGVASYRVLMPLIDGGAPLAEVAVKQPTARVKREKEDMSIAEIEAQIEALQALLAMKKAVAELE